MGVGEESVPTTQESPIQVGEIIFSVMDNLVKKFILEMQRCVLRKGSTTVTGRQTNE